jgi:hypothetical protein
MNKPIHKTTLKLFRSPPAHCRPGQALRSIEGSKIKADKTPDLLPKEQYACDVATD